MQPCLVAQIRQICTAPARQKKHTKVITKPFATERHNQSPGLVLDGDSNTTVLLNLVDGRDLDSYGFLWMFQCQLSSPTTREFNLALNTSINPGSLLDLLTFTFRLHMKVFDLRILGSYHKRDCFGRCLTIPSIPSAASERVAAAAP